MTVSIPPLRNLLSEIKRELQFFGPGVVSDASLDNSDAVVFVCCSCVLSRNKAIETRTKTRLVQIYSGGVNHADAMLRRLGVVKDMARFQIASCQKDYF